MLLTMSFLFWLLLIFVDADVVHGGVGPEDCKEARCSSDGPVIQFPFRLKGRQPVHCGYPGFDLSCTKDKETLLEMPSSSKLFVREINYTSQKIQAYPQLGCLDKDIFYQGSSAFKYVGNTILFSCPPSTLRDQYITDNFHCLARLSPCHGNPGNHSYAFGLGCSIDEIPLVSCTKVHDYKDALVYPYGFSRMYLSRIYLHWSIPSCQHCEEMGKLCMLKNEFTNHTDPQTKCFPKDKGSCTLSVILIVTGMTIYYVYSSLKREEENQLRIKRFLDEYRALKPSRYSYADIKRITEKFKEKLGQGAYGTVFKGRLSSELLVAVKILNNSNEKGEDFINEVGTMGQIHHVNVVRLIGYCADGFIRALVYEFLPNGPLQNFLSSADNENSFIGWDKLQDIALGIAKGLEYLHQGCEQQILHFDIKPHNVLLDHDFTPKVSDFGLAKLCSRDQSAVSMTARGTMGYIAPEVFSRNFGNVSYKADVYSFGTLLLEMVGGRKNFKVMEDSTSQVYFPEWIYNLLEQGNDLRIHIGDEGNVEIAETLAVVGLWCIQWYPIDRPSMKTVVQMLEREGDNLTMPPNPFASNSSSS
ncbi:putative glycerophosphodiester phosphodiesterase, protein kinase RLK-Pelle-LRK10L-2 family [Rosa chinensis]|uniref:Putative glycerophosphodiester phosphodiesterase, protein kinase RLK-Pelle-LRK10L-2 family n=1 Tax=Rosa chinensis TaxID=74649 RepID=A0A2P6QEF7_ROSCH|nr:putative glycerophosphodiester phosphodiesterase, protein kinase RLK-Pelle-LRK10L-2 family [Rosa chinensis]